MLKFGTSKYLRMLEIKAIFHVLAIFWSSVITISICRAVCELPQGSI